MSLNEQTDSQYGHDYTYREERFRQTGYKLPGYAHEQYDGSDEADPFRVETAREMRDKVKDNQLLPAGEQRAEERVDVTALAEEPEKSGSFGRRTDGRDEQQKAPMTVRYVPPQRRSRGRNVLARSLDLHAIITDVAIQKKYKFSAMDVAELRAVREEDPRLAVSVARQMLEHRGLGQVEVTSATVSQYTKAEAVNELAYLAVTEGTKAPCLINSKVLCSSRFGDKIHFLAGQHEMESDFDHEWEIICPISRAKSGLDYYKLLVTLGYDEAYARAGIAAAVLGITIVHNVSRPVLHHPTVESHAATPEDPEFDTTSLLAVAEPAAHTIELLKAIKPVKQSGRHSAYTVAVVGQGRLLNDHVRKKGTSVKFMGKELRKFQTFRLSGELFFFYDTSDVASAPAERSVAVTRPPRAGESVHLLVPNNDDTTACCCFFGPTGTIKPGFDGAWCVDAGRVDYAQHGMSGLPVVALDDGAVVAIHDGIVLGQARVLAIPENVSCDVVVEQAVSKTIAFSCPGAKSIAQVDLDNLKTRSECRRNLSAITDALACEGNRTMLECYGSRCYVGGKAGELKPLGFDFGFHVTGGPGKVSELPLRAPSVADRVVVVGRSEDGVYCSPVMAIAEHIGSTMFVLAMDGYMGAPTRDFFNGAVVVSLDDANVIGFVSAQGITGFGAFNNTLICWACDDSALITRTTELSLGKSPSAESNSASSGMFTFASVMADKHRCGPSSLLDIRVTLAELFPGVGFDDTVTYPDNHLDEVFSHPSLNCYAVEPTRRFSANRYWARMGDSAMSFLIMQEMRASEFPDSQATIQKATIQNNDRQADIARDMGLDKLYMFRAGACLSTHNLADLLEAILGWVSERTGVTSVASRSVYKILKMGLT